MRKAASTVWTHTATAAVLPLFTIDLAKGSVRSTFFEPNVGSYVTNLLGQFLDGLPLPQRIVAIPNLIPRIMAASSLTGEGQLGVVVTGNVADVRVSGLVTGEVIILQVPHSAGLPLFPKIVDPSPNEVFVYREETLGDASTGLYYVTVAARGVDQEAVDAISIIKSAAHSTAGSIGTFGIEINGAAGLFLHSISVTTYTRVETQAKMVVVIDNPQGAVKPHQIVRPSATIITGNGSQLSTPTVVPADDTGNVPQTNGIPHQLNPDATYSHIRVSAVGFAQAGENVVTDTAFNKAQSLVIQF